MQIADLRVAASGALPDLAAGIFPAAPQSAEQRVRSIAVAYQTECAQIFEITFTTAFADRKDVIRVPQASTVQRCRAPISDHCIAALPAGSLQPALRLDGIDFALRTASAIPKKNLLAEISRVGPKPPLVHAPSGAEGPAAARHFERAPAA
jgi:hypothetical protein